MTATTSSAPPRCDANNTKVGINEWGTHGIPCNATRGLRSFVDRQGTTRHACPAPGHFANVERRFGHLPIADPCIFCGRIAPILDGTYTRVTLGTGVANLCDDCREKGDEDAEPDFSYEDDRADYNVEGDPTRNGAFG